MRRGRRGAGGGRSPCIAGEGKLGVGFYTTILKPDPFSLKGVWGWISPFQLLGRGFRNTGAPRGSDFRRIHPKTSAPDSSSRADR